MEKQQRTGIYTEKKRNQFMRLRYPEGESNNGGYPDVSINELADQNSDKYIGLSKSIISKLEAEDIDIKNPPCRASTLRLYKEYFECSYDYLMGDTECKKPEYIEIGKDPILGLFDDSFYDNLKELMSNDEFQHFNKYVLEAFMSNPKWLQWFMHTTFLHLYQINQINHNSSLKKAEKDVNTAYYWFSLNTKIKEYFENALLPSLTHGFKLHEQANATRREAWEEEQRIDRERFEQELHTLDFDSDLYITAEYETWKKEQSATATISNIAVTPIEKDSQ